ncbi:MAG TPA: cardiolipin synthase B [Gemmatimonadaceae bacterium]|jgi:cardiolipin synthase|nr:cardiolipin synthase B [Gemmatimonadaceae bacterium]
MSSLVPLPAPSPKPAALATTHPTPGGPLFARGLWRIAAADASSGNRVALLRDGPRTFDCMLEVIRGARQSVDLESYIFRADDVGRMFADELRAAVARGVVVRVLTDGIGARDTPKRFMRELQSSGIAVRIFNPIGFRPWLGLVPRDHRKLLVVDGRIGVTGGIGIGEEWRDLERRGRQARWRDTAVSIEGPAAIDMQRAFELMWRRAAGEERRSSARFLVRQARGANVDPATAAGAVVGIIEGEPFRLRIARALQIQAVSAERCIWIANAYFVPSPGEIEALAGAARDGVDVRVLVPSKSDHPWVRLLTRRFYRRLLRNGVRIWEWKGAMMHAKTQVIDDRWVRVGSTDFNPLGLAVNYELDAVIEDTTLGKDAAAMFLADLEESTEIRTVPREGF